ncbi:hypothetical protein PAPHI01_2537 [Pancytospora philotis]|nr:hypothetical protein PAPHI01_2537 [Pancytospora philotis]
MDSQKGPQNTKDYLKELTVFLNKTSEVSDRLVTHLEETNYKIMQTFKPYMAPRETIEQLIAFYDAYSEATAQFKGIKADIEKAERGWKDEPALHELEEAGLVAKIRRLRDVQDGLGDYMGVGICSSLVGGIDKYVGRQARIIKRAVLGALASLPKIPDGIGKYVEFILRVGDSKEFLGQYTKKAYEQLGIFIPDNNTGALIQQTENLTSYFNFILDINREILGPAVARNINVGLIAMVMLSIKKTISGVLGTIDKDRRAEHIVFLIRLYGNLKHSEGPVIREIEELFVFRKPIRTLILNCFVQLFADIELVEAPEPRCGAERFCATMAEALAQFSKAENARKDWVEAHGPSFGVYKCSELGPNFSEKCLAKVLELSESLEGFEKYIYLINNLHAFREHTSRVGKRALREQIDKNCKIIAGLWRINLEGQKDYRVVKYLDRELGRHQQYRLPDECRRAIADELKSIIEGLMASKAVHGNIEEINEKLKNAYSGV